ncbi:hypothetical protein Tco_0633487 [Tanacetum coccineum]
MATVKLDADLQGIQVDQTKYRSMIGGLMYLTASRPDIAFATCMCALSADVPVVYLKQFWRTVSKVPDTEDTIKFMLDTKEFTYTVDMFRVTLHFPVETLENLFVD